MNAQNIAPDSVTVHFSFDGYTVNQKETYKLRSFLRGHPVANYARIIIKILGYTDTTGTEIYNMVLSAKRCRSVNNCVQQILHPPENVEFLQSPLGERGSGRQTDSLDRKVILIWYYQHDRPIQPAAMLQTEKIALEEEEKKADKITRVISKVIDTVIVLDDIYFEPDRPVLTAGSMNTLPHYINMLKKYKENDMEVGGHVNHAYPELKHSDPLFKLSEQRAELVYSYLIDGGFDPARLTYKGYGNAHMVFPLPNSLGEKMKNMRVEITVFKIF